MLMARKSVLMIATLCSLAMLFAAPASARQPRIVDDGDRVTLRGNIHPLARPEFNVGATDYSLPMERMTLSLKLTPARQSALDRLIAEQHDPASPNYHRWLSPEEFGRQFGPEPDDIDTLTGWLTSHGFTIDEVSKSRTWINFSGTVADVEGTFHTKMHDYNVNGHLRHANTQDPEIPRGFADLVTGVVSLNNFPWRSMGSGMQQTAPLETQPDYTSGSAHFMTPGDFATIYNVKPLYAAGIDGTGVTIAIVGRSNIHLSDVQTFRQRYGLPANDPVIVVNGTDPGVLASDEGEAILDVEWSGAVAKNATIKFVVSKSTNSGDGVYLSAQYIVNNNLAPVMSTSYGLCEASLGSSGNAFINGLWQQATAQGITTFVSTGDSGAAGCNVGGDTTGAGLGVNGVASTPYNVAVGGTQFAEAAGTYWNAVNASDGSSAKSYIPEVAWNNSGAAVTCPAGDTCSDLWSTGGGASTYYAKPSWQVSPGVPADGRRDIPDVSLNASTHDGYTVFQLDQYPNANYFSWVGGTSAASPSFAGLMALIVQSTGQRQGNANTRFYQLGSIQYGSGGPAVFHDITTGNNSVPGVTGYSSTVGYDPVTGLGSVNAAALVSNWESQEVTFIINNGSTYTTKAAVGLTLSYPAGAAFMQFSTNGTTWTAWKAYATTTNLTLPSGDGLKTVSVQFGDSTKGVISVVYSATITLDTKKPTGTIVINSGAKYTNTTAVTLSLAATDATSGVAEMQFSPDNKTWSAPEAFNPAKQYDIPAGDGTKKVYVRYIDNAGNVSASYSDSIILDTTAPTGTIKINGGKATTTSSTVTLTLSAKGTATQMQLSNDGVSWNDWQPYTTSIKNWTLAGTGPQTVSARFEDAAGNVSTPYSSAPITVQP